MKSNIAPLSNIYPVNGYPLDDKEFRKHVRGKSAIVTMLRAMSGFIGSGRNFHIHDVRHLLTPEQVMDFDNGSSCYLLEDKGDLVNGFIRVGDRLESACRCYNYSCHHFVKCRPGVSKADVQAQIDEVKALLEQQSERFTPILPRPVLSSIPRENNVPTDGEEEYVVDFQDPDYTELQYEPIHQDYSDVDENQQAIIKGDPSVRMLVNAGPGTGKTYSLIEKIKFMVLNHDISPAENMLVLCFTNAAVNEVKKRFNQAIKLNGWPDDLAYLDIRTFDSFATQMLSYNGVELHGKDYDERIEMAISAIESEPVILENLQHLFVDEIQDLVGLRARFVRTIIENCNGGFTLLGDMFQGIYDYQIREQPGEMDSVEFRKWVKMEYADLKTISLSINKRQNTTLSSFSSTTRSLLEFESEGDTDKFFAMIDDVPCAGKISNFNINTEDGIKTAVLCRTNGEVLKLSGYLTERGIDHSVKINSFDSKLPIWIGSLVQLQEEHFSKNEFWNWAENHEINNPENTFASLVSLIKDGSASINLRKLRTTLANGSTLPDDLYVAEDKPILVTTIHQSKGREFDRVYVLKKNHAPLEEGSQFDEAKVYYVAITRAKSSLFTINPDEYYMKKSGIGRWVQTYMYKGAKISRIEVGVDGDVNDIGFVDPSLIVDAEANQQYILQKVKPGDRITLKKIGDYYYIFHEERKIGCMSDAFNRSIKVALQKVQGYFKRFPAGIDGLFVHSIYAVVKKPETLADVGKPFSEKGVWYGVHILGLGRIDWNGIN